MAMFVASRDSLGSSGSERSNRVLDLDMGLFQPLANDLGISISDLGDLIGSPIRGHEIGTEVQLYLVNNSVVIQSLHQVIKRGREVWGNDYSKFIAWLHSPIRSLNGEKPIDLLNSTKGIEKVLKIIGRIEHGVYS